MIEQVLYIYIYINIYIYISIYIHTHTHTHTHTHIYIYIEKKSGNKPNSMKMYRNEKTQGLKRMILFIEIFRILDLYQGV